MIKITSLVFLLLFWLPQVCESTNYSIEARSAAFCPLSSRFQKVYGDVHPCYELEASITFCNGFGVWFNIDELYTSKRMRGCDRSTLNVLTFSFGPKYVHSFCCNLNGYAGIGLGIAWGRVHNHHINKEYDTSAGVVVKVGANYFFTQSCFLNIFCDYNYQPTFRNCVDIGGFRPGVGIGYQF